jgi:hypothetical protein
MIGHFWLRDCYCFLLYFVDAFLYFFLEHFNVSPTPFHARRKKYFQVLIVFVR